MGRDYSEDLDLAKSGESKEPSKPQMSKAKRLHDDLMKRITDFYDRKNQWALITENKHEVKKLKSIVPKLRVMRDWAKQKGFKKVKPNKE